MAKMAKKPAVVLGNLMMGRCFSLAGIPYIGITTKNDKRLFYSKTCIKGLSLPNPSKAPEKTLEGLLKIVDEFGEGLPLYYTNDAQLKLIAENYELISKKFKVLLPTQEVVDSSLDKNIFHKIVEKYDLPIPPTKHKSDIKDGSELDYPIIIKPTSRIHWFNSQVIKEIGSQQKVLLINNLDEFIYYREKIDQEDIDYIVQKYIPGPESNILSYHSFFDENSEPLTSYCGRKVRTYPYDYGLSCYLGLIKDDNVVKTSVDMLKKLNFRGPIKIDYKLDEQTGKIYLLEINPRYNMWHYLGAKAGINLPAIAYDYHLGNKVTSFPMAYRTDIKWLSAFQDFQVYREMKGKNLISSWGWIKSLRGKKIYQTYASDDIMPVLYGLKETSKGVIRRVRRIFS
jgi:D-aspartate ligase